VPEVIRNDQRPGAGRIAVLIKHAHATAAAGTLAAVKSPAARSPPPTITRVASSKPSAVLLCFPQFLPKDVHSLQFYPSGIPRQKIYLLPARPCGTARVVSERAPGKYSESPFRDQHAESCKPPMDDAFESAGCIEAVEACGSAVHRARAQDTRRLQK